MPNSICLEASMGEKLTVQFSLGHNVSEILHLKIIEGKYVDLALLLKIQILKMPPVRGFLWLEVMGKWFASKNLPLESTQLMKNGQMPF